MPLKADSTAKKLYVQRIVISQTAMFTHYVWVTEVMLTLEAVVGLLVVTLLEVVHHT